MDAVREDVIKLVDKELESANKKFPLFQTAHEGWAVTLEEIEELEELANRQRLRIRQLSRYQWESIKTNMPIPEQIDNYIRELKEMSVSVAVESIQIAAMAQKFIDSLGGKDER